MNYYSLLVGVLLLGTGHRWEISSFRCSTACVPSSHFFFCSFFSFSFSLYSACSCSVESEY